MSQQIRREVLKAFKRLHRTREQVFIGDQRALAAAREEINTNFRKNREITDEKEIQELVNFADDVEKELRTNVLQAVEKKPGVYEVNIREEVPRLDNVLFNADSIIKKPKRGAPRCSDAPKLEKT